MQGQGIVTVVVPLQDGETYFFAGTGSASHTEDLAAVGLSRLDAFLPKPLAALGTAVTTQTGC
jgi:hypothetical protein